MQHEMEERASRQPDFFQRTKKILREVEENFETLHQEQDKRRQAEIEQMEQRNRAWKERLAREQEQKLQEDKKRAARKEIEQKEREINRIHEEAWIRAGEEEMKREREAQQQERARQEEERKRVLEESHREAEASWNKAWEAREQAYEAQRKKKEKEQQIYEKYLPLVEERLKEKARQAEAERLQLEKEEAEAIKQSQEESRKQQETFWEEIHRNVAENEKKVELERKQLQAEMEQVQQVLEALFKPAIPINPVKISNPVDLILTPTPAESLIKRNFLEKLGIDDFELDEDFKRKEAEEEERYMANLKCQLGFNKHKTEKEVTEKNNKPTEVGATNLSADGLQDKADSALNAESSKDHARLHTEEPESVSTEKQHSEQPVKEIPQKSDTQQKENTAGKDTTEAQPSNRQEAGKQGEKEKKTNKKSCKTAVTDKEPIKAEKTQKTEKKLRSEEKDGSYKEENDEDSYEEEGEEDIQLTLNNAASEVKAYLEAVTTGILSPEEQKAACMVFLTEVEALKKREKSLYRTCNQLLMINSDFDAEAIKGCKQEAQQHLEQLGSLRVLRSQLQESCPLAKEELIACNIKINNSTERNEDEDGYEIDTSDEEKSYLYSRSDLVFKRGQVLGILNALKKAPKRTYKDFKNLALDPLTTVETLTTALQQIPELVANLCEYMNSFEGHERERGEEVGEFIAELVVDLILILFGMPTGSRRLVKLGKAVEKLVQEAKQLEKLGKTVTGIKKVDKLEKKALKKIRQTARLERRAKRKINKAAKQNRQTNEGAQGQPEVQKTGKNKKETKEWNGKYKKKKPGVGGKEGAKNPPEWAKEYCPREGESGKEFAKRIMDEKYGPVEHKKGSESEFSQIQKWADRSFE